MTNDVQNLAFWQRILLWSPGESGRGKRYSILCVLVIGLMWLPSIAYLKVAKPSYTSKWTLNLPGTGVSSSVNLESIGTASTSSTSPYGSHTINPATNYKQIAESDSVLELAAKKMHLTKEEFGKPRISLIDQTTMIFFEMKGKTGEQAQQKSYAFYEAFESILDDLRHDEIRRREESVRKMLSGAQEKLKKASAALLKYQTESKVISSDQFNQFTSYLEDIKIKLLDLKAEQSGLVGQRNQFVKNLNLNAKEASYALMLQADSVFLENFKRYAQADALLAKQLLKMDENHPEVIKVHNEVKAARQKIIDRIKLLIGQRNPDLLNRLMLSSDGTRGALFEKLITLDTQIQGNTDKIAVLEAQFITMTERLQKDMQSAAVLDDLKRDHQIAEVVFTSALARIDTGKTDIYASYPLIQMMTPPNTPIKPTSPNKKLVVAGSAGGTIFSVIGMLIVWSRKKLLRKILLNE